MLFRRKLERSMHILRERSGKAEEERAAEQDPAKQAQRAAKQNLPVEKHDLFAMILSALIVIVPIALGVLLVMVLIAWLAFGL